MAELENNDETSFKDITDVWNVSKEDLKKINDTIITLEDDLNNKHKGQYFDYQLVDDFFQGLSDIEKAMIFIYGQLVHERFYKKKTF
jgi:stress-induced morphogen